MAHSTKIPFPWPPGKKNLHKLEQKKYRKLFGFYLLEGAAAVRDALEAKADIYGVVHDKRATRRPADYDVLQRIEAAGLPAFVVDERDLRLMSGLSTPPPLIALVEMTPQQIPTLPPQKGLILALDRVNDPGNVGTLLRAAAFYGVRETWLGLGTAELYNPKTLRAAMSSHFHLTVCSGVNLVETVKKAKGEDTLTLAAMPQGGRPPVFLDRLADPQKQTSVILLLGSEAHGLHPDLVALADLQLAIPHSGPVDSLNVAMAGTVILDRLLRP